MSFWKSAAILSNIHFLRLTLTSLLIALLFISSPISSFADEAYLTVASKAEQIFNDDSNWSIPESQSQLELTVLKNLKIQRHLISRQGSSLKKKEKSPWTKQLEDITALLLQAIWDLTQKPHKVDSLKKRISSLEKTLAIHKENLNEFENVRKEVKSSSTPEAKRYFSRLAFLMNKYDPELTQLNLEEAKKDMKDILSSDESLLDSAKNQVKDFFKNRGKNLLITIATFCGLWWLLNRLRRWILRPNLFA